MPQITCLTGCPGGCYPWTKGLMAVLGQHWEEPRPCSISLTGLWDFLCMLFACSSSFLLCMCADKLFFSHNLTNIYCLFLRWTKLSTERVVGPWTGFPRAVVPTPSFSEFTHCQSASGQCS